MRLLFELANEPANFAIQPEGKPSIRYKIQVESKFERSPTEERF